MKTKFFTILFFLGIFILLAFRLTDSFNYDTDFAYDMYNVSDITQGKMVLLGPKASFGGLFSLPYYYYLFSPIVFLSKLNINAVLLFNVFLFMAALFYFFKVAEKRYGFLKAILSTLAITLIPLTSFAARNPSNSTSYIPFLLVILTYLIYKKFNKPLNLLILGFLVAVTLTFDYAAMILIIPILIFIYIGIKNKKNIIFFLVGFVCSFAPLIFFEIRHNFIIFKNTFIDQSYKQFINDTNLKSGLVENKNIFHNFLFLSQRIASFTGISSIISFIFGVVIIRLMRIKFSKEILLFILSFISFLMLVIALRFQYANHYLYPVAFFGTFSLVVLLLKSNTSILFILLIFIELLSFPRYLYNNSIRNSERFESVANYVIKNKLIKQGDSFNILQIRPDTAMAPAGFEYRFFFKKQGFTPDSVIEFNKSKVLLIFSEIPDFQIEKLNNWEISQFGTEYLKKSTVYQIGDLKLYKVLKD